MNFPRKRVIYFVMAIIMTMSVFSGYDIVNAASISYQLDGLVIEGAPANTDTTAAGPTKTIDLVNPVFGTAVPIKNSISIFTPGNRVYVSSGTVKTNVAVVVDSKMTVTKVINKAPAPGVKPGFTESTDVPVPEGGFVLLAYDDSYANAGYKKFLAENFKVGDVVKLKRNNELISVSQILSLTGQNAPKEASLNLDYSQMYTTTDQTATVKGAVYDMGQGITYSINIKKIDTNGNMINEPDAQGYFTNVNASGVFNTQIPLGSGVNYLDVSLVANGSIITGSTRSMIIFKKDQVTADKDKEIVMWIDQFTNIKTLNTREKIDKMIQSAKNAGVTAFSLDIKGPEGYVSYKQNNLSGSPYLTETTNTTKKVDVDIDVLKEFIEAAHSRNLKVYTSFNFFTEGNVITNDSAVIANHPDWMEIIQAPEDKGQLKKVTESARKNTLIFVNPANDEVRAFQLARAQEVLQNYDIDAIVMDRTRYDNQYADFSDVTKAKFSAYLSERGKTLNQWPQDAFSIDASGNMVKGVYYYDWLTFRSSVIKSFTDELRSLVDSHNKNSSDNVKLAAYVGAWYESYYQNGVNWADDSFVYNKRMGFPEESLYTPEYAKTSYLNNLDFLMIGTYYKTEQEISKYATMGNILTNGQVPLYASIDITTSTVTPAEQRVGFQAAYGNTSGCMIFDLCYVDWYALQCAIQDIAYENPNVVGFSTRDPNTFTLASNLNTSRTEDSVILYDNRYGDTTGTNQYGVEVVVGADNVVTAVKNKTQAMTWNWAAPEANNSTIPAGGFVLSAVDRSGSRVYRQLLGNGYSVGEHVYAAILTDFLQYKTAIFNTSTTDLSLTVNKIGGDSTVKVLVNGNEASLVDAATGKYSIPVALSNGSNSFRAEVLINGSKVLEKQLVLTAQNIQPVTIALNQSQLTLAAGQSAALTAAVNAPNPTVTWSVYSESSPGTVQVNQSGLVTAIKVGNATVRATSTVSASVYADCSVTVTAPAPVNSGNNNTGYVPPATQPTDTTKVDVKLADLLAAIQNAKGNTIKIDAQPLKETKNVVVQIPAQQLIDIGNKNIKELEVNTGLATVTVPTDILKDAIKASSAKVELSVTKVTTEGLTDAVKKVVGNNQVYDFTLSVDGNKITSFGTHKVDVEVSYTLKAGEEPNKVVVYYIADNGSLETITNGRYNVKTGKLEFSVKHFSKYAAGYVNVAFNDIGNVSWAKESIEALAARKVIDGTGNNTYDPDSNITRAEFIKLLMNALELVDGKTQCSLSDVKQGEWYYDSIAAAQKLGIVVGKEDGSFGVDDKISRQDMAVMVYRAAKLVKKDSVNQTAGINEFIDKSDIAGYAADPITYIKEAGLILGDNGKFLPNNNSTRAESAVIIYRLFGYVK